MDREPAAQTSYLNHLPYEIAHTILCEFDSIDTLCCAILSCRWLYNVFSSCPSVITSRVLANELDLYDMRRDALTAFQASKIARPRRLALQGFYTDHFREKTADCSIHLTLGEAIRVSRLHSTVSRLAEEFAKRTLTDLVASVSGHNSQSPKASVPEKQRIMRALYAIEVFFSIFRHTSMARKGRCMNDFLQVFAHWEVEQIACVYDFLLLKVSPSFDEMAVHDVYWGRFMVEPTSNGSSEIHSVLLMGLVTIESIAKTKTYSERHELFGQVPATRRFNLSGALNRVDHQISNAPNTWVSNFRNSQEYAATVKRPSFEDPDEGPFTILKWAERSGTVSLRDRVILRKLGYVMWDQARLDALGILRDEWEPRAVDPVTKVDYDTWWSSSQERGQIYEQGGSGWWDFSDESQVVWEGAGEY